MVLQSCIVVVRDKRASAYAAGDSLFYELLAGPSALDRIAALPRLDAIPSKVHAGWLADLDERRVLLFHAEGGGPVLLPPVERFAEAYDRWSGFELRWHDRPDCLSTYVTGDRSVFAGAAIPEAERLDALLRVPPERLERLRAEDAALSAIAAAPLERKRPGGLLLLLPFLVLLPIALLVRLVTLPFRQRLVARSDGADIDASRSAERAALHACEAPATDVDAHLHRGLVLMQARRPAAAELAFDACVDRLEGGATARTSLAAALHNRAIARSQLGLERLAARDRERAHALDPSLAPPRGARATLVSIRGFYAGAFRFLAGLAD